MQRDLIQEMLVARAKADAFHAKQAKVVQAEARRVHEAKRDAHRAETRASYPGSDHEFDKLWRDVIEPEWQRSQLSTGGVEGTIAQLLASGKYADW
jgi:hypothetical protein